MGSARNTLKEVHSRAEDIKSIEQTILELAQMFNDLTLSPPDIPLLILMKKKVTQL
jgi:hypothetical protein